MNDHHNHHKATYFKMWIALLILTVITVAAAYVDFGSMNMVIAMAIASLKATLVALYFMHLKEDNRLNQVVFTSSFFFLLIFVGLTLADTEYRDKELQYISIEKIEAPAGNENALHEKFKDSSPELLAQGKAVYQQQCALCHGETGEGNGPAGASLNPAPRDFTSDYWKQGGEPSHVFQTISNGIPGSSMSAYANLSVKDRWALTHYVRSFASNPPAETKESFANSKLIVEGDSTAGESKVKLPVDFAIELLVEEAK